MEMEELALKEKVNILEDALIQLARQSRITEMKIARLSDEMRDFKDEMKDFKDEMLEFKNEMKDFKDEMLEFKDEMKDFKDEMKDFKDGVIVFQNEMKAFKDEMLDFKNEMKEFKDEMKVFKDGVVAFQNEMKDFKDEMKEFKDGVVAFQDEMKDFKDEMRAFKDEMREFKIEVNEDRKRMNKQWGELANKMGTIVEDIVAPAIGPVVRKYFNCDPEEIAIRIKRKKNGLKDEFDAICVCKDKVFLFEVKSTPRPEYVFDFKNKKKENFLKLFPEHKDKELVLIFASLRLEEDILNLLTKQKILGMAYKEWEYMDILNFSDVYGEC